MKYWKPLSLFLVGIIAVIALSGAYSAQSAKPKGARQGSIAGLAQQYDEKCLSPDQASHPVWECYEISVDKAPHQAVTVQHESGEQYKVLTFKDKRQTKFRFTPTQPGMWSFSTGGKIDISADRPDYAKGFVTSKGNKWIRSATAEAFVPQFIMYDKPELETGLDEFIEGHGFSGFHIINLRDLVENPTYFEAVVLKTYRRGGVTHFWLWGDESRKLTPDTYGVDVNLLYTEIAARLAPLPGWTLGYGFDLFEWASAQEIEQFRAQLQENCSYHHMIGGRGYKNEYREISSNLDYAAWEWHHPDYQEYREHLAQANQRPAFSEDRFRIWDSNHPRDYDTAQTRQGLWHSAMAGGVANIWGNRPSGEEFSAPYPNQEAIKTYSRFINATFNANMAVDNELINTGYCLRDGNQSAICYAEQPDSIQIDLTKIAAPQQVIAIDTQKAYKEIELDTSGASFSWQAPRSSDWAFHIFTASDG